MLQGLKKHILLLAVVLMLSAVSLTPLEPFSGGQNSAAPPEPGVQTIQGQGRGGVQPQEPGSVGRAGEQQGSPLGKPQNSNENFEGETGQPAEGRLNVLLMGVDARGHEPGRTDSLMLVSMNPQDNSAAVLSVLRDTYVTIPTPKPQKNRINVAYSIGGPSLTLRTVSDFLQLPIEYYIVLDFEGFEKAVDAIGGVELEVEKPMDYVDDGKYDIHLKPGKQILDGRQALGYARFRHDATGDYTRVERQRKLLKAILEKVQGVQAVYYLPKVLEAVKPYIKTNLDLSGLANLAYLGYQLNEVTTRTVPSEVAHSEQTIGGMAVLVPNLAKTRREVKAQLGGGIK